MRLAGVALALLFPCVSFAQSATNYPQKPGNGTA
jgi:hypothetical protein